MSAASAQAGGETDRLQKLRGLVVERLIDILENGVPVQKPDPKTGLAAEIGRAPAPPAYLSAAIRLLKDFTDNSSPGAAEEQETLASLLEDLAEADDEEDDLDA